MLIFAILCLLLGFLQLVLTECQLGADLLGDCSGEGGKQVKSRGEEPVRAVFSFRTVRVGPVGGCHPPVVLVHDTHRQVLQTA